MTPLPRVGMPGLSEPTLTAPPRAVGALTVIALAPTVVHVYRMVQVYCSDVVFVSQLPGTAIPSVAWKICDRPAVLVIVADVQVVLTLVSVPWSPAFALTPDSGAQ